MHASKPSLLWLILMDPMFAHIFFESRARDPLKFVCLLLLLHVHIVISFSGYVSVCVYCALSSIEKKLFYHTKKENEKLDGVCRAILLSFVRVQSDKN